MNSLFWIACLSFQLSFAIPDFTIHRWIITRNLLDIISRKRKRCSSKIFKEDRKYYCWSKILVVQQLFSFLLCIFTLHFRYNTKKIKMIFYLLVFIVKKRIFKTKKIKSALKTSQKIHKRDLKRQTHNLWFCSTFKLTIFLEGFEISFIFWFSWAKINSPNWIYLCKVLSLKRYFGVTNSSLEKLLEWLSFLIFQNLPELQY